MMAKDAPGMRGYRSRNEGGQLREKRGDTHMGNIEALYGRNFGVRGDIRVEDVFDCFKKGKSPA